MLLFKKFKQSLKRSDRYVYRKFNGVNKNKMKNQGTDSYTKRANIGAFTRFLHYVWPANDRDIKKRVIISFVLIFLSKIAAAGIPLFFKKAIDIFSSHTEALFGIGLFFIAIYGTSRLLSVGLLELKEVFFAKVEQQAVRLMATEAFAYLQQLSLRFHLDRQTGALTRVMERGSQAAETFLKFSMFHLLPTFIEILLVLSFIAYFYGVLLAGIVFMGIGLYIGYSIAITEWRAKFVRQMNEADNICSHQAVESLLNYETVKYFANDALEVQRFDRVQKNYETAAIKNKMGLALLNAGQGLIVSLGVITTLLYVSYEFIHHRLSVGDVVLLNAYLIQLYQPLSILGFAYREIKRALVDMENLFTLLNAPIEIQDSPTAIDLIVEHGTIEFKNVSFAYQPDRPILKNISFKVPAGKKVAIVGKSGSGKSTIGRLLFRFYDVSQGAILVEDHDIRHVTQLSLRRQIGIVPQDVVLFNDTLEYNIHYGRMEATQGDIVKATQNAHLDDFIAALPKGYNTMVGERGLKLSGGEKQRVAIARTVLKHPKIFLFDEATSSLDSSTEKSIQQNLNHISAHRTTLVIAHRLSTIVDADEIIVLDQGEIIEQGKHAELLKKKGVYATMWEKQGRGVEE